MAAGRDKHQGHLDAIALQGKDLARRAKRKCELCEENDDQRPYDLDPKAEPSLDTLVLLCQRCRAVADGRTDDPRTLRFLESTVWSEVEPVAGLARTLIARVDADWARQALDLIS